MATSADGTFGGRAARGSTDEPRTGQQTLHESQQTLHESQQTLHESQQTLRESQQTLRENQQALRDSELALRESEERLRRLADDLPLIVWLHDPEGRRTLTNQAYREYFGTSEEDLGRPWRALLHPDDAPAYIRAFTECTRALRPFHGEVRVRRGDGRWRWLESWARPRFADDGTYLGHVGTSADVTDRKRTEQALRESEQRFRTMADNLPLIVWMHDADGHQEFVNETFCRYFGVSREHMQDGRWRMLLHPEDEPAYSGEFSRCVRERLAFHAEVRVQRGDGQWRWIESWARPRFADDNTYLGHVGTSADVTDRRRSQEREHEISLRLQRALLPEVIVRHPRVEIAARYVASSETLEVGGDWYDTYALPDGRVGVSVGDVVGHGLEAAASMGRLRAALAALAPLSSSPARMLTDLDAFVSGPNGAEYATATCAVLDTRTGSLRYACAGHPPLLLVLPDGEATWLWEGSSVSLCRLAGGSPRPEAGVTLTPGSLVIAYSDGLVERRRLTIDVGMERLRQVAQRTAGASCEDLCDRLIMEMTGGVVQEDDIVVACLRFLGPGAEGETDPEEHRP